MILPIHQQVHSAVSEAIRRKYALVEVPPFAIETPPNRALGDLAVTVAFQLARTLRKAPRVIAQELAEAYDKVCNKKYSDEELNNLKNYLVKRYHVTMESLNE